MKNSLNLISIILLSGLLTTSCTMHKRQYRSGYNVQWLSNSNKIHKSKSSNVVIESENLNKSDYLENKNNDQNLTASAGEGPVIIGTEYSSLYNETLSNRQPLIADSCDRIITREGEIILGKVLEIGLNTIKYKLCDNLNGPIHNVTKSSVFLIEYVNGTKQVIKEQEAEESQTEYYKEQASISNNEDVIKTVDGLSFGGFLITLISLPIWAFIYGIGFIAGPLGIIFGAIGLSNTIKNSETKTGKGLAIVSLILGVVLFIGTLARGITAI
jgi:hypothetical protein